jgi:uncharacterized protein YkwD
VSNLKDDIGDKVIGDTHTHIDFPYKCRYCGKYVKIEHRHPWLHDCVDESIIEKVRSEEPVAETITEETPTLGVDVIEKSDHAIHSTLIHIRKKKIHLIGKEHADGSDWFSWTYFFKTKKEAEWVFEQAKKKNSNVVEDKEDDSRLDRIQLRKSSKIPSVTFIYNRFKKTPKAPPKWPSIKMPPKAIKVLISILLIVAIILYFIFANVTTEIPEDTNKTKIVTVDQTIPSKISFSKYIENPYNYDKKEVTLKGFLRRFVRGDGDSGVYVESIVDDGGNEIDLVNLDSQLKSYFPNKGITKDIYLVKGIFDRKYKTLELQTKTITITERDPASQIKVNKTVSYTETKINKITRPKFPLIRQFVFNLIGKEVKCEDGTILDRCSGNKPYYCTLYGLTEKPVTCGCPSGERLYKNQCIPEVKCFDGTLEPECSKNKPKQCVDGELTDNADLCGCPEGDYRKVGKSCEKIKRCSDGTEYDHCSSEKPFYCVNGNLVNKASKCGCPSQYYPDGDKCLEKTRLIEKKIFEYTNYERKNNGISELKWDDKIAEIARSHSKDMAENNFFSHENLRGEDPTDRAQRMGFNREKQLGGGYYTYGLAENIGMMTSGSIVGIGYVSNDPESIAKAQVTSWMQSSGHRENILNFQYSHLGVGVAYDGSDYISTQNFW